MMSKLQSVRTRAALGEVFQLTKKLDDPEATIEAIASTALDVIEQARDEGVDRILRWEEVHRMVGISKQAVYQRIGRGTFPKPVPLGGIGPRRRVGWLRSEVRTWLREQVKSR